MNSKIDFYIKIIGDSEQIEIILNRFYKKIDSCKNSLDEKYNTFKITDVKYNNVECEKDIPKKEFQNDDLIFIQLSNELFDMSGNPAIIDTAIKSLISLFDTFILKESVFIMYYVSEDKDYQGVRVLDRIGIMEYNEAFVSDNFEEKEAISESDKILKEWVNYCPIYWIKRRILSN